MIKRLEYRQEIRLHGCRGCTKPQIFGKSPFAHTDFEVFITKYLHPLILRPRALFYRTDYTRRSKFLTHVLIADVPPDTIKIWMHIYLKWPCISHEKSMMRGITNGTIEMEIFLCSSSFLYLLYHIKLVSNMNLLKLEIRFCFIANWQLQFQAAPLYP